MPEAKPILTLHDVSKVYRMGDIEVPVLHQIDLDIFDGQITVIVGPSGSGKSTLLNMVGGLDIPTSGMIFFRGQDISQYSSRQLTEYRREKIGFVFQFYNLVANLNARENVVVSTEISKRPMLPADALELVGLAHRSEHFPAQLSGGEQQRVAIARAVAKNPDLLLCDEPTGALDLTTGQMILQALIDLNQNLGTTIIIITHNEPISGISHRLVRLGSGNIVEVTENQRRIPSHEVTW